MSVATQHLSTVNTLRTFPLPGAFARTPWLQTSFAFKEIKTSCQLEEVPLRWQRLSLNVEFGAPFVHSQWMLNARGIFLFHVPSHDLELSHELGVSNPCRHLLVQFFAASHLR